MCEIAIVSAERLGNGHVVDLANTLYAANNDGLGVVAVYRDTDAERFGYVTFKDTAPDMADVTDFVNETDDAWRHIIHARLATAGGTGVEETHPIDVDCECTDAMKVIHNGVVRGATHRRGRHESNGCSYNTEVDTEVIAHTLPEIPRYLESDSGGYTERFSTALSAQKQLYGRLNYILLGEDRILVRTNSKYAVEPNFLMRCNRRDVGQIDGSVSNEWLLVTPEGSEAVSRQNGTGYSRATSQTPTTAGNSSGGAATASAVSDEEYWNRNAKYDGRGTDRGYGGGSNADAEDNFRDGEEWVRNEDGEWVPKSSLDSESGVPPESRADNLGADSGDVAGDGRDAVALAALFASEDPEVVSRPCTTCGSSTLYDYGAAINCHTCGEVWEKGDGGRLVPLPEPEGGATEAAGD